MTGKLLRLCMFVVICVCGAVLLAGCSGKQQDAGPPRIVFIAADPSHGEGEHEWDQDAELVRKYLLEATNLGDMTIDIYNGGWPANASDLDSADAIIFFADGRKMHPLTDPARLQKIDQLAKKGMGLAFIHYSIDPPEGQLDRMLEWIGGGYEAGYSQNPINTTTVTVLDNGHPITRGCGGYTTEDEWYFDIRFRLNDESVVPLMTGKLPPRDPQDKVLAWAVERKDGGRGFGFSGGHHHKNYLMEPFRKLILNAICWTAKIEVPAGGVESVQPWKFVSISDFVNADANCPQPGWEDTLDYVLEAIKAEDPRFVLVGGDLVGGDWPDKDAVKERAGLYYPAWTKRMDDHGLKYYTTVGGSDIGGYAWTPEKAELASYMKRQFYKYLKMPLNGPLRMRGTAFWFIHENTLFVSVDVFEEEEGKIVCRVSGEQLEWFEQTLANNSGVEHVVVVGHCPILGPVKQANAAEMTLEGGKDSPLWQAMAKHGVDLYLCGEVDEPAAVRNDVQQIATGGRPGVDAVVSYLVATVYGDKMELEIKRIPVATSGKPLDGGLVENITIDDATREKGFETAGAATLDKTGDAAKLTDVSGCFQ